MRRTDREITDFNEIMAVVRKCSVCRVAFFDAEYPYIVPLNFGAETDEKRLSLYFHCAGAGKKLELLKRCNRVGFEMDCPEKLLEGKKACYSTMTFESVCGSGTVQIVGDDDKIRALTLLMRQYSAKLEFEFGERDLKAVTVLKLTVDEITGKRLEV